MVGRNNHNKEHVQKWQDVHGHAQADEKEELPCSSFEEGSSSTISNGSSSSSLRCCSSSSSLDNPLDDDDDASSSAHSSRSSLYDLSELMSHLPIKRGLSKFYHGKSDSFTSLARVTSIEDLPKKEKLPYKRIKNSFKSHTLPKPIISKKKPRNKHFGSSFKKDLKE